jgi:three-Cys-motif partner protein
MNSDNVVIGEDGFPVTKVGEWTLEKHERLRKYVDITRAVRRKFKETETTYIELFCGPGRSMIDGTGELIEGSPVLAARKAKDTSVPYSDFHLADAEAAFINAVRRRMPEDAGRIYPYIGLAEHTVDEITSRLNPQGLHFAFLDPYKLDPLPFSIINKLAKLRYMDILVHVSIQDFQRNLRRYMSEVGGPLDRFAPGWRAVVNPRDSDKNVRLAIFNYWLGLIRSLDMQAESHEVERVSGLQNQPLYWLVLVARHELAHELWDKIRNVSPQRRFPW